MTMQIEDLEMTYPSPGNGLHVEPTARRVRAYFAGTPIADSKRALLVLEPRRLPVYYFPMQDVRMDLLRSTAYSNGALGAGSPVARWSLEYANRTVDNIAWSYRAPDAAHAPLLDHVAFYWAKLDAWFE